MVSGKENFIDHKSVIFHIENLTKGFKVLKREEDRIVKEHILNVLGHF